MGQTEHKNIKIRSRKDLEAIRERTRPLLEVERGARIVVGMGTCGLAAGARQVYEAMGSVSLSLWWRCTSPEACAPPMCT